MFGFLSLACFAEVMQLLSGLVSHQTDEMLMFDNVEKLRSARAVDESIQKRVVLVAPKYMSGRGSSRQVKPRASLYGFTRRINVIGAQICHISGLQEAFYQQET